MKYTIDKLCLRVKASLPSRERGLKLKMPYGSLRICPVAPLAGARIEILSMHSHLPDIESLPSRERGLKYTIDKLCLRVKASLPSRERGLKLKMPYGSLRICPVAPLAGARIEILSMHSHLPDIESLPSRERGLKYTIDKLCLRVKASLPSRERGLKLLSAASVQQEPGSLPSRERGLKFLVGMMIFLCRCRSPRGSAD